MWTIEVMLSPLRASLTPLSAIRRSLCACFRRFAFFHFRFEFDFLRSPLCIFCGLGCRPMAHISAILPAESSQKFRIQPELPTTHTHPLTRLALSCARHGSVIRNFSCVSIWCKDQHFDTLAGTPRRWPEAEPEAGPRGRTMETCLVFDAWP